ncbi:Amino acid adenylation [Shewanella denitrificans OS217]|uniref:Amino acid adenylation n=1 Tax=Shewanella denitrificans (strain OS217 / ATCC BAA-1090 / DSM 15013) TaxID=318161 RepID=Q12IB7_SHEDO|nr:non-ribosomal peptide synthetase [Shewanella denitrificans]ABE56809.1 Amino acid adenylation [Shewanella denitrificans OS217]
MTKYFVHKKFAETASLFPNETAIVESQRQISYQQLNTYANNLAYHISDTRHQIGTPVGLFLPKSIEYILGVLAVLKSDQAFLPLSPEQPDARLGDILRKAQPSLIMTTKELALSLKKTLAALDLQHITIKIFNYGNTGELELTHLDSGALLHKPYPDTEPQMSATPEDSNYIIFTSGTTGDPKAIVGCHKSLSHFIHWEMKEFALSSHLRIAQLAPITFDVSLRDIFVPLLSGGVCCIPEPEVQFDARRLLLWISNSHINLIHCVPSIFRLLMTELEADNNTQEYNRQKLSHLKHILLAGEPLFGRDANRWITLVGNDIELVNLYGPSETTLAKLFYRLKGPVEQANQMIPIGNPIANTAVLILANNTLCRVGDIGEIYIKTPFRSKGYLNDQPLTDLSFIQNPLNPDNEDIIYKTGDLGRYLENHSVEVLGRLDRQVKLNGIRVELNDIEGHIHNLSAIDQCFINLYKDEDQSSKLVCYYTCHQDISTNEIKDLLADKLSTNLIPSMMIKLSSFPLMLNGKVDKKALPNPATYFNDFNIEEEQDLSPTELILSEIWRTSLGAASLSKYHHFFDLGGTSLAVMKVLGEMYRQLNIEISIQDFYQHDTISALADHIDKLPVLTGAHYQAITLAPKQQYYPLSRQQQSLWLSETLADQQGQFTIPGACQLTGDLNRQAFNQAIDALISRHDNLRIVIDEEDNGSPIQRIKGDFHYPLDIIDLSTRPDAAKQARTIMLNDSQQAFNLAEAPLFRLKLFRLDKQTHYLYFCFHHLIFDAWSMGLFGQELMSAYQILATGGEYKPAPLAVQYQDFCHWQTLEQQQKKQIAQKNYWLDLFAHPTPMLELPTDFPRPQQKHFRGAQLDFTIDSGMTKQLKQLSINQNSSLFSLLMSIYQVLLAKYTNEQDIVVGFPTAGRGHPDLNPLMGMFVNTLPLRSQCEDKLSFNEFLRQTTNNINDALDHQSYGLEDLVNALDLPRDMSRSPLFDTIFMLQNFEQIEQKNAQLILSELPALQHTPWYDLTLKWIESEGLLHCNIIYDEDLFTSATVSRLGQHFTTIVRMVLAQPDIKLADISLLTAAQQLQLIDDLRPNDSPINEPNIVGCFENQAKIAPSTIALSFFEQKISYESLNRQANQLARYMQTLGVKPGDVIGCHMPRSPLMITSALAILKLGAIYLPLEISYPQARKEYIIADSGISFVLSNTNKEDDNLSHIFKDICWINADAPQIINFDSNNLPLIPATNDLAYIIYTSGSTGKPKGTLGHHLGVVNLAQHFKAYLNLTANDRFLQFANCSFDASIFEIFITLLSGSTLVLITEEIILDTHDFEDYLNQQQVTVTVLPPTYVRQLTPEHLNSLKTLLTAGSTTDHTLVEKWWDKVRYINAYGPTETTVCASVFEVSATAWADLKQNNKPIPIGKAISNLRLDVLDSHLQQLPAGISGELYISGLGVSHGYLNQTGLTKQCFTQNPHMPELPMYKTGDLARRLADGNIEFLGRKDDQVKIRGYRIEPMEIEYQLLQLEQIADARVLVNGKASQQYLSAYYIGVADDESIIRQALSSTLPKYMIPSTFTALRTFPMTPNNKVDSSALRQLSEQQKGGIISLPNSKDIEASITSIWKRILNINHINQTQSFIELGGDSIKAIQTVAELKKLGLKIKANHILQYPTIEQLSQHVTYALQEDNIQVQGQVPLTPIQQWFFNHYQGDKNKFFQHALLSFTDKIHQATLQQAMQEVMKQHDSLRSSFVYDIDSKQWRQEVLTPNISIDFHCIHLEKIDHTLMAIHMNALANQNWLNKSTLLQGIIFKAETSDDHVFLLAHHLIVDTVSWWILLDDIEKSYQQLLAGKKVDLGSKTSSLQQWSQQLHKFSKSETLQQERELWCQTDQALNSAFRFAPSKEQTDTDNISLVLSQSQTKALLRQNIHQGIAVHELVLTLHARAMANIFGANQYSVIIENHGREECFDTLDVSRTVGWFTSIYPLVLAQNKPCPLLLDIAKTKNILQQAPNKGLGYGVLNYLPNNKSITETYSNIMPQASFNYYGTFDRQSQRSRIVDVAKFDLPALRPPLQHVMDISGSIRGGQLHIELHYNNNRLATDLAQQWLAHINKELIDYIHLKYDKKMAKVEQAFEQKLQTGIDKILTQYEIPGLVLGARFPNGETVICCRGISNTQTQAKLTKNHQFRIGSLSKTFVATLILQLVDEGKISLTQAVGDILSPSLINNSGIDKKITVRQLLNHTSGLEDYINNGEFKDICLNQPEKIWEPEELLRYFNTAVTPPLLETHSQWRYSSSGYILLGLIIEKVTGEKFEQRLFNRITAPLGLQNTHFADNNACQKSLASGHDKQLNPLPNKDTSFTWAAGGLISTVEDLLTWQAAINDGRLLSQEMQKQRLDFIDLPAHVSLDQHIQAGLGIFNIEGHLGHVGDMLGHEAAILAHDDVQLVVLLNGETKHPAMVFGGSIFEAIFELI